MFALESLDFEGLSRPCTRTITLSISNRYVPIDSVFGQSSNGNFRIYVQMTSALLAARTEYLNICASVTDPPSMQVGIISDTDAKAANVALANGILSWTGSPCVFQAVCPC